MGKDLYYLSQAQLEYIRLCFPLSHGVSRIDDKKVINRIIYVIKNGLQWKDAPSEYGPYRTILQPIRPIEPHGYLQQNLQETISPNQFRRTVDD